MQRSELLAHLAQTLAGRPCAHPLRVAIDGMDAAGKSTLAGELAAPLAALGRRVIRASIDGFHNPRHIRCRRGMDSPLGYYSDAYNYPALLEALLLPLGPGGSRCYRTAVFDYLSDQPVFPAEEIAGATDILLFDGVFLLRPELSMAFDFTLFLDIRFETCLERALLRDAGLFGGPETVLERYQKRYLPAQQHYLQACQPRQRCDLLIDNNNLQEPILRTTATSNSR